MTYEIIKQCLMCNVIYYPKPYTPNPKHQISHGICEDKDCISSYILLCSGGDEGLADKIKNELRKEK